MIESQVYYINIRKLTSSLHLFENNLVVIDLSDQIIKITMSAQWSRGEQIGYRLVSLVTYWSPIGHICHKLFTLVTIGHILVNLLRIQSCC